MELKRIINTKFCLIVVAFLFVNVLLFVKDNRQSGVTSRIYDEMVNNSLTYINETSSVRQAAIEGYKQYVESINMELLSEERKTVIKDARTKLLENADYVDNYVNLIDENLCTCEQQLKLSIFSDKKSFEYLNLLKTRQDLSKVKNNRIKLSNGIWLDHVVKFRYTEVFLLIIMIMVVYSFFNEQKTGLIYIIGATKNGKMRLFFRRLVMLLWVSVVSSFLLYITTAITSIAIHGGIGGILDAVSCDSGYLLSGYGMNRLEYVIVLALLAALSCFALALTAWFVMSFFANVNTGLILFVIIYGIEYILYVFVSAKSIFRFVKYINLAALNEIGTTFANYQNWGYSWWIADVSETSLVIALVTAAVMGGLCFYRNVARHITSKLNAIEKVFLWIEGGLMRLVENASYMIKELYKLLFSQRVIFPLVILILLANNVEIGNKVSYNTEMSYYKTFFEKANGLKYGDELLSILSQYDREYEQFAHSLSKDEPDYEQVILARKSMLGYITERVNYVKEKNEAGIDAVIIMPYEYEFAFGTRQLENRLFLLFLCIVASILISSTFYSYEKKSGMLSIIKTSDLRNKWCAKKYLTGCMVLSVFTLAEYFIYYRKLFSLYDLKDVSFAVQSLEIFSKVPFKIPLWAFLLMDMLLTLIALVLVGIIISDLTAKLSYVYSMLAGFVIIVPQLLYMLGIQGAKEWSLCTYISGIMAYNGAGVSLHYIILAVLGWLGIWAFIRRILWQHL